ncbi:MAG: helix-turn-helix domain-containing protein [Roseiflexaceae bacterium]
MHLIDIILSQTADVFRRTPDELVGRSRKRQIVEARQAAMWAIRQRYPSLSLETIGMALGGRHYTTVMHALDAVEERARRDATYRIQLEHLIARVSASSKRPRSLNCGELSRHADK